MHFFTPFTLNSLLAFVTLNSLLAFFTLKFLTCTFLLYMLESGELSSPVCYVGDGFWGLVVVDVLLVGVFLFAVFSECCVLAY